MHLHETVRVPAERVGVIVGRNGRVRKRVERLTNTKIEVDSEGIVKITGREDTEDPVLAWKAKDIIRAMARGFSPKNALSGKFRSNSSNRSGWPLWVNWLPASLTTLATLWP